MNLGANFLQLLANLLRLAANMPASSETGLSWL
jgi:hypothetical protein